MNDDDAAFMTRAERAQAELGAALVGCLAGGDRAATEAARSILIPKRYGRSAAAAAWLEFQGEAAEAALDIFEARKIAERVRGPVWSGQAHYYVDGKLVALVARDRGLVFKIRASLVGGES